MNSRQRLLTTITGGTPDRLPCAPHLAIAMAQAMPPAEWDALRAACDVTPIAGILGDAEIVGGQWYIDHKRVTRSGADTIIEVDTPKGTLRSVHHATPEATWTAEHLFKDAADVERMLSIPYEPPAVDASQFLAWEEWLGDDGLLALSVCSSFRFVYGVFGSQAIYELIADDVDLVEQVIAETSRRLMIFLQRCLDAGITSFWMGGAEHCGPGVVHPRYFRRLVVPYDQPAVALIHARGGIVNYHQHGKLKDILDDIAAIGPDVLSPVETGLRGDVTLAEAKARLAGKVCIKGNLDDMAFLAQATEAEVRQAARDCIAQAAEGGGYILSGTDADIYSPEWVKSMLVMAEVAAEYTY
ncbi:MAG TPA: hypothetical protein GX714_05740 [Chloroflexi bacterium]|jgi:hypothetical protein|nr:hypothetical protein [Chloroflexota bacterium]